MSKKILSLCLCFVLTVSLFTGCKVEFPNDAANQYANVDVSQIQSDISRDSSSLMQSQENDIDSQNSEELTDSFVSPDTSVESASSALTLSDSTADFDVKTPDTIRTQKNEASSPASQPNVSSDAAATSSGKKDQYQTDPIPEGKPAPVEPQNAAIDKNKQHYCTLSINCQTILSNMDNFNKDKLSVLPSDGIILSSRQVSFYEGESVFDVLLRETKKNRIHMEFVMTPIYNSNYIKGIHNLYEFDCGNLSGWMYRVNEWFPNYGCSRYQLHSGDTVEWVYTCDLGRDVGDTWTGKDYFSDGGK